MSIHGFYVDLKSHPRKAWDLFLFVLFNIVLNGIDVFLDILTAMALGKLIIFHIDKLTIDCFVSTQ